MSEKKSFEKSTMDGGKSDKSNVQELGVGKIPSANELEDRILVVASHGSSKDSVGSHGSSSKEINTKNSFSESPKLRLSGLDFDVNNIDLENKIDVEPKQISSKARKLLEGEYVPTTKNGEPILTTNLGLKAKHLVNRAKERGGRAIISGPLSGVDGGAFPTTSPSSKRGEFRSSTVAVGEGTTKPGGGGNTRKSRKSAVRGPDQAALLDSSADGMVKQRQDSNETTRKVKFVAESNSGVRDPERREREEQGYRTHAAPVNQQANPMGKQFTGLSGQLGYANPYLMNQIDSEINKKVSTPGGVLSNLGGQNTGKKISRPESPLSPGQPIPSVIISGLATQLVRGPSGIISDTTTDKGDSPNNYGKSNASGLLNGPSREILAFSSKQSKDDISVDQLQQSQSVDSIDLPFSDQEHDDSFSPASNSMGGGALSGGTEGRTGSKGRRIKTQSSKGGKENTMLRRVSQRENRFVRGNLIVGRSVGRGKAHCKLNKFKSHHGNLTQSSGIARGGVNLVAQSLGASDMSLYDLNNPLMSDGQHTNTMMEGVMPYVKGGPIQAEGPVDVLWGGGQQPERPITPQETWLMMTMSQLSNGPMNEADLSRQKEFWRKDIVRSITEAKIAKKDDALQSSNMSKKAARMKDKILAADDKREKLQVTMNRDVIKKVEKSGQYAHIPDDIKREMREKLMERHAAAIRKQQSQVYKKVALSPRLGTPRHVSLETVKRDVFNDGGFSVMLEHFRRGGLLFPHKGLSGGLLPETDVAHEKWVTELEKVGEGKLDVQRVERTYEPTRINRRPAQVDYKRADRCTGIEDNWYWRRYSDEDRAALRKSEPKGMRRTVFSGVLYRPTTLSQEISKRSLQSSGYEPKPGALDKFEKWKNQMHVDRNFPPNLSEYGPSGSPKTKDAHELLSKVSGQEKTYYYVDTENVRIPTPGTVMSQAMARAKSADPNCVTQNQFLKSADTSGLRTRLRVKSQKFTTLPKTSWMTESVSWEGRLNQDFQNNRERKKLVANGSIFGIIAGKGS